MAQQHTGRHRARRSWLSALAVGLVLALAGYLLAVNIRVNRSVTVSSDTAQLVEERVRRVAALRQQVNDMSAEIDALRDLTSGGAASDNDTSDDGDAGAGTVLPAVAGPGVTVTLDDSPIWQQKVAESGSSANINDYVVHQQDIESVVNALWAGGAEAMRIQDQRVLPTTAVRCVGNVLLLEGRKYSPPYRISAIGPRDRMVAVLNASPSVRIYQQYVKSDGLGWTLEQPNSLRFPAAPLLQSLRYASVDRG